MLLVATTNEVQAIILRHRDTLLGSRSFIDRVLLGKSLISSVGCPVALVILSWLVEAIVASILLLVVVVIDWGLRPSISSVKVLLDAPTAQILVLLVIVWVATVVEEGRVLRRHVHH